MQNGLHTSRPSVRRPESAADSAQAQRLRALLGGLVLSVGLTLLSSWKTAGVGTGEANAILVMSLLAMMMGLSMMAPLFGFDIVCEIDSATSGMSNGLAAADGDGDGGE